MRLLLTWHRYLALAAALFVVLVALSGSALVFEGAIDHALNPRLWRVHDPGTKPLSLDSLAERVRANYGEPVITATIAQDRDLADVFFTGHLQVYVDPYTAELLGTRTAAQTNRAFARRLHQFHVTLMGGAAGRQVVDIVCVLALALAASGVVLWWPTKRWRVSGEGSWLRTTTDLHHVVGVCIALIVLVITGSGVLIAYDSVARLVGSVGSGPRPSERIYVAGAPGDAPRLGLDSTAAIARTALPGARITFIQMPPVPASPLAIVAMRFPEDHTPGGRSRVFIDSYRGLPVHVESTRDVAFGARINNVKRSLHTGDEFGPVGRVLWCLAALALALQAVTGVLTWAGRRARVIAPAEDRQGSTSTVALPAGSRRVAP